MNNNDKPTQSPSDSVSADSSPLTSIIFNLLGAAFALLAALSIFFEFGPPLIFGTAAGACMLISNKLFKK